MSKQKPFFSDLFVVMSEENRIFARNYKNST
ncbi:hypothetical protein SAMN04487901_11640 [Prevotella communis]|uniref:Uncharacterized protein n=1 Tax=Prevotella communis TaxID=2913614 RepID=A0A1H0EC72_9BACT|nr:hypothetical protein SAMN04487901_11640 [Prevotella communis]SDN79928.1 hypothetical protein SAMN04487900_10392 [Prevotella communis]